MVSFYAVAPGHGSLYNTFEEHTAMTDAQSATISILSAGAPKIGVGRCAKAFSRKTGHEVDLVFATAPALREQLEAGKVTADILVAPVPHMTDYARDGRIVAGTEVVVGSVTAGVAVRKGTPKPDLSSVESFRQALLAADAVIYNTASSGQFVEGMIEGLGLAGALAGKTERVPTGTAVMVRLAEGTAASEIGFGQITEIRRFEDVVTVVGPLPVEIGKKTTYAAGLLAGAAAFEAARALLDFLASPEARRICAEAGLE